METFDDGVEILAFDDAAGFESWLAENHEQRSRVWLKLAKKSSGVASVTPDQVIDVALCFGWIDGQRRAYDDVVAFMRQLKERAGLTFRQLEEIAAERGDVLARSTVANVLSRRSLPRREVLAAFVRACGSGDEADAWLDARDRLAALPKVLKASPGSPQTPEAPPLDPRRAARSWWTGRTRLLLASVAVLVMFALGAWMVLRDTSGVRGSETTGVSSLSVPSAAAPSRAPADGWSRIRPAGSPKLCVTEGRDRTGRYHSAVAVQRPCAGATPPQTYVETVGDGLRYIQWHHPVHGKGCLTVLVADGHAVRNMLEPWPTCDADRTTQQFRFEPVDTPVAGGYRLRVAYSGLCLGSSGDSTTSGAEIVQERCTGESDQEFLVDAVK